MNINQYFSNMRLMNISLHNKTSSRYIYSHLIYPIIPLRSIMGFPVVQLLRSCIFGHNYPFEYYRRSNLGFPIIQLLRSCIFGHNYPFEYNRRSNLGFPIIQLLRSCIFGHNYPFEYNRRSNLGFPIIQLLCSCIFGHNYPFASYLFHYSGFLLNDSSAIPFLLTPSPYKLCK